MELLGELGIFAAKVLLIVVAFLMIIGGIARAARRGGPGPDEGRGDLRLRKLNDRWKQVGSRMQRALLPPKELKVRQQAEKAEKAKAKLSPTGNRPRIYVLDFDGNVRATQVAGLREEITAILEAARPIDEVVVRLKSPGGLVYAYGLAASQLQRLRDRGLKLTIAVDQVAASGGYMMATVGTQILAAPFAIIGSIGVVAGFPNFNRWLKKHDVDFELHTAGRFKRTLTMFGENTDEGRKKFQQDLEDAHTLFKAHIAQTRPQLDVERVATGEHWYGTQALGLGLIDRVVTSDDYLAEHKSSADIWHLQFVPRRRMFDRISASVQSAVERGVERVWEKSEEQRFL